VADRNAEGEFTGMKYPALGTRREEMILLGIKLHLVLPTLNGAICIEHWAADAETSVHVTFCAQNHVYTRSCSRGGNLIPCTLQDFRTGRRNGVRSEPVPGDEPLWKANPSVPRAWRLRR
jgi:hypothetical protein